MFEELYNILKEEKAVAVIRTNTYEEAKEISMAAIDGGMKIIEITMSVPNAPKLIKELKEAYKGTYVGAGTVLTKDAVDECIDNNADFIVSPCIDEEIISYASQRKALIIPGLMTMSEVNKAYKLGLRFIKLFPGSVVGKGFIGAAKSIFPDINIMPTGGVNKDNISEWIQAGADCGGIGSDLNKVYKSNGVVGVKEYCVKVMAKVK
ncbi:bifunctional 4-hydroxy-2-oxoglutarate aldolase/2-dehydro-3-deoxy-phosphogluconate aldolase [Clostridium sp. 'White wine YQ']|uniref:bifunctional 4-hydroxy-2-oxoglutarate aldolase/2-dehydro-3-deoxy-phosphogluconate aldolase n=1 Tax=Clostridium sp. 'White wine YQ' TaxID=3027474 RepID=UPI002365932E|nr:bifunctional 4-hydroxy-2-oxoglutarate aldolase/2-dehydro-3-deoxy-phosphogluconate aldolase [Clostridium sp. 'White wine YQ']MDD7794769.1 bifunctional 4-hydroxy-2-oxoglutarate aldolase/2-dehydro-3-deoxy-phosphogluconate aldolase [Clostridium sp. 'White wine YQ']